MPKQIAKYPIPTDSFHKERLLRHVRKGESADACWEWTASRDNIKGGGHGRVRIKDIEYVASRLSYGVHYGVDPGDKCVCHTCDNPTCTNPHHLYLGTHLDNMQDASRRGRFSRVNRRGKYGGADHPSTKLSDLQVTEIKERYRNEAISQRDLAEEYGVSQGAVSDVIQGKRRNGSYVRDAWRSIDSAPKDGSIILLAAPPSAPGDLYWRFGVGAFSPSVGSIPGLLWDWDYGRRPTHWLPLSPPRESGRASALEFDDLGRPDLAAGRVLKQESVAAPGRRPGNHGSLEPETERGRAMAPRWRKA